MAAKKKRVSNKVKMDEVDRIANAERLKARLAIQKEIQGLGYRGSTAPREVGKPPAPSAQYRGLSNALNALSNPIKGNSFVSRSNDAKAPKGTARAWRGGGLFRGGSIRGLK
jgi:hypothetical protein